MLRELLRDDVGHLYSLLTTDGLQMEEPDLALFEVAAALYRLLLKMEPNHPEHMSRLAIAHHLNGELRAAGHTYGEVLRLHPPQPPTASELASIMRYAPLLHINKQEYFPLLDVVAIHHPDQPMISYHLFWQDDYDFPDDYEPCDHEVVWVAYDVDRGTVRNVWSFFHSHVLTTEQAVVVANRNDGQTSVYVEWGKHGSLLDGWEAVQDEHGRYFARDVMHHDYAQVSRGGRVPTHPLKRWWPEKFVGEYADYLDFSEVLDLRQRIVEKPLVATTRYANAVLQQQFLRYNFHPKYDWPAHG